MTDVCKLLKETRLSRGLSLDEVAQKTYIKVHYLEALEASRLDLLPEPVHIFGFIRLYARLLGLDGGALVAQFQQQFGINLSGQVKQHAVSSYNNGYQTMNGSGHASSNGNGSANGLGLRDEIGSGNGGSTMNGDAHVTFRDGGHTEGHRGIEMPMLGNGGDSSEVRQARQIVAEAEREARQMMRGAEAYADEVLSKLEREVENALQIVINGRNFLASRRDAGRWGR